MVGAGFERDPGGGATQIVARGARIAHGHHLRVRPSGLLGEPAAEDAARAVADDAADARIGVRQADRLFGQGQRLAQPRAVQLGKDGHRRVKAGATKSGR